MPEAGNELWLCDDKTVGLRKPGSQLLPPVRRATTFITDTQISRGLGRLPGFQKTHFVSSPAPRHRGVSLLTFPVKGTLTRNTVSA